MPSSYVKKGQWNPCRDYRRFLWSKVFLIWRTPCSKSKQIEYPNYMGRYSITLVYNLYYANSFMHMANVM